MPIADETEISKLLDSKEINAVTIDTNIFDEKGLQLNSTVLQAVSKLKPKSMSFILPKTVANEIRRHLERSIQNAAQTAEKAIGQALFAFETKSPTRDEIMSFISENKSITDASNGKFESYIKSTNCEILDDYSLVSTEMIFDDYFKGNPPFGQGKKKSEFPDALALNALEKRAGESGKSIIVVSKDADWHSFCKASDRLYIVSEIERALSLINATPAVRKEALVDWLTDDEAGQPLLYQMLEKEVERIEFSVDGHSTSGEMEAHAWSPELVAVTWPAEEDIDVIEIENIDEKNFLSVFSFPILIDLRIHVEVEFSAWDGIDKENISLGSTEIVFTEEFDTRLLVNLSVNDFGEPEVNIDIEKADLENYFFSVDIGEVDPFGPDRYGDDE